MLMRSAAEKPNDVQTREATRRVVSELCSVISDLAGADMASILQIEAMSAIQAGCDLGLAIDDRLLTVVHEMRRSARLDQEIKIRTAVKEFRDTAAERYANMALAYDEAVTQMVGETTSERVFKVACQIEEEQAARIGLDIAQDGAATSRAFRDVREKLRIADEDAAAFRSDAPEEPAIEDGVIRPLPVGHRTGGTATSGRPADVISIADFRRT